MKLGVWSLCFLISMAGVMVGSIFIEWIRNNGIAIMFLLAVTLGAKSILEEDKRRRRKKKK